ncbi:MAG TPA: lysine--tRNA ligase [Rhodopirellula baltica]|uniref:Lysine--tRNA ligase n=1 Tax=Rhodopirellula baltica (strain DSM 10527 / NCIMB 13988 / SH1) TaxID=243090 RepID=Q7UK37_RHOBA|nr:lysyl-tRNA synthetase [Rhodopirellula baltica SH 1]HBE63772.1 lysine--tRNA ligase [Rhodopirellula baltica]
MNEAANSQSSARLIVSTFASAFAVTDTPSNADDLDLTDPHAARRHKLEEITAKGIDPWGQRFDDRLLVSECRDRIPQIQWQQKDGETIALPDVESDEVDYRQWKADNGPGEEIGPIVRVAGRILLARPTGKLIFMNIRDWTGDIQIFVGKKQVGDENFDLAKLFDLGDLIGVQGRLGRTNTGELTVFAEELFLLTKMLEVPPEKHAGMTNQDLRQRMRYADLAFNDGVMQTFLDRTKIIKSIRSTLDDQGFCEVEGPTLHTVPGGAAARPFETHHNALDMQLTMRIALELHLKRLMVGGMERVYELGRVYRNEGLSPRHNPEFTMLETYQAYGNYESMMDLTEKIICDAIEKIGGGFKREYNGTMLDFTPPFQRATYAELFQKATGIDPANEDAVKEYAKGLKLTIEGKHPDVIRNEIFEEKVEDSLQGPIFVTDYPASICPLTKRKKDNPEIAERFEMFICGMELANAYTELNDPDLQEELFKTQLEGQDDEDSMAKMDHDFVRALRYGMPPAGGLGIGIDRLVMVLTNQKSIRDVILFPVLRPE